MQQAVHAGRRAPAVGGQSGLVRSSLLTHTSLLDPFCRQLTTARRRGGWGWVRASAKRSALLPAAACDQATPLFFPTSSNEGLAAGSASLVAGTRSYLVLVVDNNLTGNCGNHPIDLELDAATDSLGSSASTLAGGANGRRWYIPPPQDSAIHRRALGRRISKRASTCEGDSVSG